MATWKQQGGYIEKYLIALEQFSVAADRDALEQQTKLLAKRINTAATSNADMAKLSTSISASDRKALEALSTSAIIESTHGKVLSRVLQRDALLIGTQLAVMSAMLAKFNDMIASRALLKLDENYRVNIVQPFVESGSYPQLGTKQWQTILSRQHNSTNCRRQLHCQERLCRFGSKT